MGAWCTIPPMTIDLAELPHWFFPLVMFCLGVFFLTFIIRRFVEGYLAGFAKRNQWQKVWLPSLPTVFGGLAAGIMSKYPFLDTLPTWGTRVMYGCVAGGLCSFMYKVVQAVIVARLGVKIGESSAPPPGPVSRDISTIPVPEKPTDSTSSEKKSV